MAIKTIRLDDLDPAAEATETVLFSVNGDFYEVDLGEKNAASLRTALGKYMKAGRPVEQRIAVRRLANGGQNGNGNGGGDFDPQVVRSWAQGKGLDVSDKGRVPEHVVAQWRRETTQQ